MITMGKCGSGSQMNEKKFREYKNYMDKDFITYLSNHYLINVFHRYGHNSVPGSGKTFFATDMHNDAVSNFVTYKLIKDFGVNKFKRIYINLHFNGMDGEWHHDDGKETYMLMVTPTLKKGSGCFEIKENNKIQPVAFEQNKLVIFKAKFQHRGRAPVEKNTPRITLAFKSI